MVDNGYALFVGIAVVLGAVVLALAFVGAVWLIFS